jgi:hypothetical protein
MRTARRCRAKAKATGRRCENPAAYGMPVCRFHGARKKSAIRSGPAHPNFKHGQRTLEAMSTHEADMKLLGDINKILKKKGLIK